MALVLLAAALPGITARLFPRWLAWPAPIIGIMQLVIPVSFTGFLLVLPWALAASTVMIIRPARDTPAPHREPVDTLAGHAVVNS